MLFSAFKANIRKKQFSTVYLISSPDIFLREAAQNMLCKALEEDWGVSSLNLRVDLDQTPLDDILNSASTSSLFGSKQIILIKGIIKLREGRGNQLKNYLENPNPDSILIFLTEALSQKDKQKTIYKILVKSQCQVVDLEPLNEQQMKGWVIRQLEKRGISIETEALESLIELQGTDLGRLNMEIEKLIAFCNLKKKINLEMVQSVAGFSRDHTVFDLMDALLNRNHKNALRLSHELTANPRDMLLIVAFLSKRLRTLLEIKELSKTMGLGEMALKIGGSSYFLKKLLVPAKQLSRKTLVTALETLAKIDDGIKQSSLNTNILMDLLVRDLTKTPDAKRTAG